MLPNHTQHRLQYQHLQLDTLLQGLPNDFLLTRHRSDKWSIHENLAHLGRYQEIFIQRTQRILEEKQPQFGRYKAEQDVVFEKWTELSPPMVIQQSKFARQNIASLLLQLNEEQLNKTGTHPKLGVLNIAEWTEFFLLHEQHHFYTIFWLIHEFR